MQYAKFIKSSAGNETWKYIQHRPLQLSWTEFSNPIKPDYKNSSIGFLLFFK